MATNLPPNTFFRSAAPIHDEEDDGYMIGYHLQYQLYHMLVNVVFLSSMDPGGNGYYNSTKAEDKLLQKYEAATLSFQDGPDVESAMMEREEAVYEEIRNWAEELCLPTFLELARTSTYEVKAPESTSLFQYLHPQVINLQITTQGDDELRVIRYGHDRPPPWPDSVRQTLFPLTTSILTSSDDENDIPSYSPEQITVVELAAVPKVVVQGLEGEQIMCFKSNTRDDVFTKEYTSLKKIKDAGIDSLRVPRLRGLVTEAGGVVGLLLEFIEPSYSTLSAAMGEENAYYAPGMKPEKPSQNRKLKWARQIQQTVFQLHDIDIVWGDIKPDNILIDKEDNAWVLDFGGGWTVGWVDEGSADTKEGDLQGLEKIMEYLGGVVDDDNFKPEEPEEPDSNLLPDSS